MIDFILSRLNEKLNCTVSPATLMFSSSFMFRFLNQMAPLPFLILAVISRGLMGLGSNASFTAMFAIIFQEFSERAITVLSLSEALVGVGGMVAPLIGGGLYDVSVLLLRLVSL